MVRTRKSDAAPGTPAIGKDKQNKSRGDDMYKQVEEYVMRVKDLEITNKQLREELRRSGGDDTVGKGIRCSTRMSSPNCVKKMRDLRQHIQTLESKIKEARRENQQLREQFNESFEDAREKFRSQGRIHGNLMAAKKADEFSGQILYLKDSVHRLEKTVKELEAERRRLQQEVKEVDELRNDLKRAEERHAMLERNVENLQDENENLERELEHQEGRHSLGVVVEEEKPGVPELEAEIRTLKEQVEGLTEDLRTRMSAAEETESLKDEVEELRASLKAATSADRERREARDSIVTQLEVCREQARKEKDRCQELQKRAEALVEAQKAAEEKARRLEDSPSRTIVKARATALESTVKSLEGELSLLRRERNKNLGDVDALQEDKEALEDEVRRLALQIEQQRRQAEAVLARETESLERKIDRLQEELDTANAKSVAAVEASASAVARALQEVGPASAARRQGRGTSLGGTEEGSEQRLLVEENARLRREVDVYRELAGSQHDQISLVYIQEVNAQADYLVVENRTNLDVSLAGWALGTSLSESEIQFEFPEELMLSSRASLKVWWGARNISYKSRPTRGNLFWEESDRIDIFQAQNDEVLLMDAEGCEMSRMRIVSDKRRARAGPFVGTPTPDSKRFRSSPWSGGGSGMRDNFGVRTSILDEDQGESDMFMMAVEGSFNEEEG
ncbi:Prefoldin [Nannochloropsis gaditana]|uniref:Prefoldin n=1 Tax=Nannochloropsis gaditana TaxID=72520 RepID=W7TPS6_9STRA|nr:Prefoldin [Nannochloropsis gaditana]